MKTIRTFWAVRTLLIVAVSFTASMLPGLAADTVAPTLVITSPKPGQRWWSNAVFRVTGTAKDNVGVSNVWCQLSGQDWTLATGTTNWSADLTLAAGTNYVRAFAVDTSGNTSQVATSSVVYAVSNRLMLLVYPAAGGTVSGVANAQWLEINRTYKATATASSAQGYGFVNWAWTTNYSGWATSTAPVLNFAMQADLVLVACFADVQSPALKITSPTANQRWSNAVFRVAGTAKDNLQVSNVWCLTNGVWGLASTTNSWTNWTVDVALLPKTNSVMAYAEDAAGHRSPTNSVKFIYVVTDRLTLLTTGQGTVSPNYSNAVIEIGTTNTLTAKAGAGYLFSNWVGSVLGNVVLVTNTPKLSFVMQSNLVLQANIVTNPFLPLVGSYYGLVCDPSNGVQQASAGFLSATLGNTGLFSAKLLLGGRTNTFTGQFDLGGHLVRTLPQTGGSPVTLGLQLGPDTLSGTVSNAAWVSTLEAYRARFNATTNPCPYAGRYTFALPAETGAPECPEGSGYGLVTVDKAGNAVLTGTLADGTVLAQSVPMSKEGDWPLYVPLYNGQGSLIAWLRFTLPAGLTNEAASWIKPTNSLSKYYAAGFTNVSEIAGSSYLYVKTNLLLALTNGLMIFSGGNLAAPVTNDVLLTATNRLINLSTNPLSVTVNTSDGYLSGWFKVPGLKQTNQFKGVLLQEQNLGDGYFLGTNQSGRVLLSPAP